jgi:ABC-type transporter Mla MlaB component
MGLFSFLKKKDEAPPAKAAARPRPDAGTKPGTATNPSTRMPLDSEAERERQREIARATAAKIDEIELEMASDIFDDEAWGSPRRAPAVASGAPSAALVDLNTDGLLGPEHALDAAVPASAPAVEEAAILYANGQADAAEHALRASLAQAGSDRMPWWMLFDLYQAEAREEAFDSIAIDYASRFETSPPAYRALARAGAAPASGGRGLQGDDAAGFSGVSPTASLGGRLDGGAGVQLARILAAPSGGPAASTLPSPSAPVRLEFSTVASATPEGCAVLLDALQTLRRAGRELVLAGADHLVGVLRPMLAIGEGSASQAPWLLLLELLLLMNREKDFEETAMDYCVTFEVSPPSFEAPARTALSVGISVALNLGINSGAASDRVDGDRFLLPAIVGGDSAALLAAIDAYAAGRGALVLDCSRLARIDYGAAAALVTRLRVLAAHAGAGRQIELRDLNHLVAALLRLLGADEPIRLYAHRY